MADESLIKSIAYEYPFYEIYLEPHGALTLDIECHACFYYGMLAYKARRLAGKGPESQTLVYNIHDPLVDRPRWLIQRDEEIAKSVALIYALESPEQFLTFKARAWMQAKLLGVDIPQEVFEVSPGRRYDA